jgi:DhnA family fructose-bisphosphate aldolase class Ia
MQRCLDSLLGPAMPGIIVRIDWTTLWGVPGGNGSEELRSCLVARPEDAMRNGADAVLTYLAVGTGDSDFEAKEVARNAEVARECERIGMPLIIETLARGKNVKNPAAQSHGDALDRHSAGNGGDRHRFSAFQCSPSVRFSRWSAGF